MAVCAAAACVDTEEHLGVVKAALDTDGDGVDDSVDNCASAWNQNQANANFDAEDALSLTPRGDACDPQPVAWLYNESFEVNAGAMGEYQDIVTSPLIQSQVATQTPDGPDIPYTERVARDGLRFCICDDAVVNTPAARAACEDSPDFCTVGDWLDYDEATHTTTAWKTMTVDWARPRLYAEPFPLPHDTIPGDEIRSSGDEVVMDYWDATDRNEASARWDIFGDSEDWSITPPCTTPDEGPPYVPGACWDDEQDETFFHGVVGVHTPGDTDLESMPTVDGFYATLTNYDNPNRKLTFNYRSGPYQRRRTTYSDPPSSDDLWGINFLPESDCLHCAMGFPDSFFLFDQCPTGTCDPPMLRFRDGYLDDASGPFHPDTYQEMGELENVRWVAAAEPRSWRGDGDGVLWAAVEELGREVVLVVALDDGLLVTPALGSPQTQPSARTDFGVAMSYGEDEVYVIGGYAQGSPIEEMWTYNLGTDTWSEKGISGNPPHAVLAATYLPAEDAVLVLDVEDGTDDVRLLRVPRAGGTVTELGSWPKTIENFKVFAMTALDHGVGYAVACLDKNGDHTVLQFARTSNGASLTGYASGDGPLLSSMMGSHPLGVTVLVESSSDAPTPAGYGFAAFDAATGSTPELCF